MNNVLITGGTGSMGQTLVRRLLDTKLDVDTVTVFSRDEAKQFDMAQEYRDNPRVRFQIGDIRDYASVLSAMRGKQIVIHAAALKQVPSTEYWPDQAVLTNCVGMMNVVRACQELESSGHPVNTVCTISTDKACKPTTAMGMSKALQEKIFVAANLTCRTRFVGVRYGNVLESRGSVIPLFKKQIAAGGPVTITSPTMTRFLLSLDQAADIVFAALALGRSGDIFVPKAPSAHVGAIAEVLIGDKPVKIETIGVRPGEKYHEVMVSREEGSHTIKSRSAYGDYYVIVPQLVGLVHARDEAHPFFASEYSSASCTMSVAETAALLQQHGVIE
jgi:FlaA1/EpsC-like NDP-sugar epimerase